MVPLNGPALVTLKRRNEEEIFPETPEKKTKITPADINIIKISKRSREKALDIFEFDPRTDPTKKQKINELPVPVVSTTDTIDHDQDDSQPISNFSNKIEEIDDLSLCLTKLLHIGKLKERAHTLSVTPQNMLPPLDRGKIWVESLWAKQEIMIIQDDDNIELIFSPTLKKSLDDTQLELVLKKSSHPLIREITYFCFNQYPCLSSKSAEPLLTLCPYLHRTSFQNISNKKFYDFIVRIEGNEIALNKHLASHFSLFLKCAFDLHKNDILIIDDKHKYEHLNGFNFLAIQDFNFLAIQDCINILVGSYDIKNQKNSTHKCSVFAYLMIFEFIFILEEHEHSLIEALDWLKRTNKQFILNSMLSLINTKLSENFKIGKFPNLKLKLLEMSVIG